MLLWANAYAAKNRVSCGKTATSTATVKAVDIPVTAFLTSTEDYDCLKERMSVVISRILANYVPFFRQQSQVYHVPHLYSVESAQKSELVCNRSVLHISFCLHYLSNTDCLQSFQS